MYKNLTRFTASDKPAARRSLPHVIIITYCIAGLSKGTFVHASTSKSQVSSKQQHRIDAQLSRLGANTSPIIYLILASPSPNLLFNILTLQV
jgi:hypothetical protein